MIAVILAGGSGTRFWPVSRRARPKQLVELYGGKSMLEHTVDRLSGLVPTERILVVTGADLLEATMASLPALDTDQFIAEPVPRNTAPAIALATAVAKQRFGDEVLVVLPSDHYVADAAGFRQRLADAAEAATPGRIVTLGITPTRPETGYGYIHYDADAKHGSTYEVHSFVEKPDRETATHYLQAGDYLWNAGIFVFRPESMMDELARQLPAMATGVSDIAGHWGTPRWDDVLEAEFGALEQVSIDYGVMEGAEDVAVVPADVGWSDVGHWNALQAVVLPDEDGNIVHGEVVAIDSSDCVVFDATDGVTAVVGVKGLAVVHTNDAVLVVPRSRAQDVRAVVAELESKGILKT